jgi:hypothetical protein
MKGYPKHINTKQDLDNLLAMPEFKTRALADLKRIQAVAVKEATVTRVVSGSQEKGDLVTEEIPNPMPIWKRIGFKDKKELDTLESEKETEIDGK